jgi:hypothetical protein
MSCGICGGQSGTGAGFLQVLGFPCQVLFHQVLHIPHDLSGAGTVGQLADVANGFSFTLPQETKGSRSLSFSVIHKSIYHGWQYGIQYKITLHE